MVNTPKYLRPCFAGSSRGPFASTFLVTSFAEPEPWPHAVVGYRPAAVDWSPGATDYWPLASAGTSPAALFAAANASCFELGRAFVFGSDRFLLEERVSSSIGLVVGRPAIAASFFGWHFAELQRLV